MRGDDRVRRPSQAHRQESNPTPLAKNQLYVRDSIVTAQRSAALARRVPRKNPKVRSPEALVGPEQQIARNAPARPRSLCPCALHGYVWERQSGPRPITKHRSGGVRGTIASLCDLYATGCGARPRHWPALCGRGGDGGGRRTHLCVFIGVANG